MAYKSKNNSKMKWYLIIGGGLIAVYYFLFNTTTGQSLVAQAKATVTPKTA